jgi:hypothetical protein
MKKYLAINPSKSQAPVTHTYNTGYLGGREQEDCLSRPAKANSSGDPILKYPKRASRVVEHLHYKHETLGTEGEGTISKEGKDFLH